MPPPSLPQSTTPALALTADQQLDRGFSVAFGSTASGEGAYRPEGILPIGSHLAIIAVKTNEKVHAEPGTLAIQYLNRSGDVFSMSGTRLEVRTGSSGPIAGWKVRRDLADNPIVVVEGGGTWQGCTSSGVTLIELTPDRPRTIVDFIPVIYSNDSGFGTAGFFEGKLSRAGHGIKVSYSASSSKTVTYVRRGDRLIPTSRSPQTC
ncbi:MAG: hypothetical protein EOP94_00920 [Zymomonas sp.]|nr:MAG: hypothetical protein EOP94_00920 [Zymomonas sp.]